MSEKQNVEASGLNRAKPYQLVLFPLNNGATNVYYVLVLSYIATFGSNVLALGLMFASIMVTAMRLCDAITDWCIDRPHQWQVRKVPSIYGDRKSDHGSQHYLTLYRNAVYSGRYDAAALCSLCTFVFCMGYRIHFPDFLYQIRTDRTY